MSGLTTSISTKVDSVVHELAPDQTVGITDGSHLVDELGFSSMNLMELAFVVEEEFEFPPIDISETMSITTVGELKEFVARKLS